MVIFQIGTTPGLATGLLVGVMPIGGVLGSIITPFFVKFYTRRRVHYIICGLNIISMALVQIENFPSVLAGRFLLGVCGSVYTMIAPQYTR